MGCDIHFRVEYYAREETVVQTEDGVKVVSDGLWLWRPAERLTPSATRARMVEYYRQKVADGKFTQESVDLHLASYPEFDIAYEDRFYTNRNYALFGKLSGVRTSGYDEVVGEDHPRFGTLPEDCCREIAEELDVYDADLHSHGWATLTELLATDWSDLHEDGEENYGYSGFRDTLLQMEAVAIEKCGGNTDDVRAIWAFDN